MEYNNHYENSSLKQQEEEEDILVEKCSTNETINRNQEDQGQEQDLKQNLNENKDACSRFLEICRDCGYKCFQSGDYYCNRCLYFSRFLSNIIEKCIPDSHPYDKFARTATYIFDTVIHYYTVAEVYYEYDLKPKFTKKTKKE